MRGVRSSLLGLLLSFLMVSTSISASACDLSCWLQHGHSGCNAVDTVTTNVDTGAMSMPSNMDMRQVESERVGGETATDSMSMSPDMGMGPDHSEGTAGSDANLNARPDHSMVMPAQPEGVTDNSSSAAKVGIGSRAMLNHSGTLSSCLHEPCGQASMSVSPRTGDHPQLRSLHWMPTDISNPLDLWSSFHRIRPGIPPSGIPAVDHLTTTLRI